MPVSLLRLLRNCSETGSALLLVAACSGGAPADEDAASPRETRGKGSKAAFQDATVELARQLGSKSDAVVIGKVWRTQVFDHGPAGEPGIHTQIVLMTYRTLLGTAQEQVSFWVQGGQLGQRLRRVSRQARFAPGEEVVVFLAADAQDNLWPTDMSAGKWRLERSAAVWRVVADPAEPGTTAGRKASITGEPRVFEVTSLLHALRAPGGGS